MGKRSNFERVERDFYPTPLPAVKALIPHIDFITNFIEPCAGDGSLVDLLESYDKKCVFKSDIEPRREDIHKCDALDISAGLYDSEAEVIITNPPWDRSLLHPMIMHFVSLKPTWLLFDADWMHTKQARTYMPYVKAIVSIGRVKWIPDSRSTGKDNCCWYLFEKDLYLGTKFHGRHWEKK